MASNPFSRLQSGPAFDGELIDMLRDCAKRKLPALRRIYDLTAPRLLAELLQMLGDREVAESALQDCFIQIWNEAGNFNPQRSQPQTWLLSITRHHAVEILRENRTEKSDEVDSALNFAHVGLHYESGPQELQLLQLAWRTGRSPEEIARALQLPLRQVKTQIRQGLATLGRTSS